MTWPGMAGLAECSGTTGKVGGVYIVRRTVENE